MLEKIVQNNKRITSLDSSEITRVIFSDTYANYFIRNNSDSTAYASDSLFTEDTISSDGVISIPKNCAACIFGSMVSSDKDIFIKGNVTIVATNSNINPFKQGQVGESKLIEKDIDSNGTYLASSENADGFSSVNVSVNPNLADKEITSNGTYTAADDNAQGYSKVIVNVPEKNLIELSVTENGEYFPMSSSFQGYSKVTVDVPSQDNGRAYIYDCCKNLLAESFTYIDDESSGGIVTVQKNGLMHNGIFVRSGRTFIIKGFGDVQSDKYQALGLCIAANDYLNIRLQINLYSDSALIQSFETSTFSMQHMMSDVLISFIDMTSESIFMQYFDNTIISQMKITVFTPDVYISRIWFDEDSEIESL